jgi:hypothetical protein
MTASVEIRRGIHAGRLSCEQLPVLGEQPSPSVPRRFFDTAKSRVLHAGGFFAQRPRDVATVKFVSSQLPPMVLSGRDPVIVKSKRQTWALGCCERTAGRLSISAVRLQECRALTQRDIKVLRHAAEAP